MKNTIKFIVTATGSQGLEIIFKIYGLLKKISGTFGCETSITFNCEEKKITVGFNGKFADLSFPLHIDGLTRAVDELNNIIGTSEPINFDTMDKVQLREFAKGAGFKIANNWSEEKVRDFLKNNFPKKQE